MNRQRAKTFWIMTITVALLSLGFIWLGLKLVLQQTINTQNLLAYAMLSVVFGGLSGAFYAMDMKAAFALFLAGLIVGYCLMLWQFITGLDGWGDLAGLLYLFMCAAIGLALGLITQLLLYLFKKSKRR